MADTSQAELPPQTNGISDIDDEERTKMRPVDIDADVKEMERRKRVESIMNSRLFREELERIIESQLKDGSGPSGLLQQISDMVGVNKQSGNVFKNSSCVIPINDIRGIEAMGYAKGEKLLRCKLACLYRLIDLYGWAHGSSTLITARLNQDDEQFLVNPYGMLFHEVTASSLIKIDMQGGVIEQGTTNFSVNIAAFSLHAAVHSARPDIRCIIHVHTPSVVAISSLKHGILPLSQESVVIGEVSTHTYLGGLLDPEEKDKLARNLGPSNKILLLSNQGALCCGETIEEAFFNARNTVLASESQLKLLPIGIDNLVLINDEIRKRIYDAAHKPPESTPRPDQPSILESKVERKWRVGGVEFEALMRMLDNAGFRTGYIYRHPLVKGDPPRPKNDVEVPPAVSSLGYLLEEEEFYKQGLWRKLEGGRKGSDRSRWLNSPNTYQKVEILETGTADPKKITKWVADGSPSHSTPVKIDDALQFVPKGTNPKEFKQKQQQIKDYRRADKISAGPQSHILEGVTWEEAKKMQDATVTQAGDHVVLMGAASKGIIQRGHQHNAMVYKSPYAKNPFDCITDEELDEYKKVVEKKVKGDYDTDFSESEGLSSAALNKRMDEVHIRSPTSVTSETEEESRDEPQILRIETKTAPRPSQPEVVLSDVEASPVEKFLKAERISVDSFKGHKLIQPMYYRTHSHAGFPKGSYLVPNPTHFHITRQTQIAIRRPVLVSVAKHNKSSHYLFNHGSKSNNSTVTINLGQAHSVSVKIPFETLTGFIFPLASALNFRKSPVLNNQACQTAYMNNFEYVSSREDLNKVTYTPLYIDSYRTCQTKPENANKTTSFEKRILANMQEHMLVDLSSESEYESFEVMNESYYESTKGDIIEFNEDDQEANESLVQITSEVAAMIPSTGSSSDISENPTNMDPNKDEQTKVDVQKITENNQRDYLNIPNNTSRDEGIDDCTMMETVYEDAVLDKTVEEIIIQLSNLILEYLIQQCYELKELILFPEVLHDSNFSKLLTKMTQVYSEFYRTNLSPEEKNEIRVSLATHTLKLLEIDERFNNSGDSGGSNTVSDKVFSISEFLNDILDHFFNSLETGGQFAEFALPLDNSDESVFHSTPEQKRKQRKVRDNEDENFEITTFHKKTVKSGSDIYWMSVSNSPSLPKKPDTPQRPIINVDDIPLRPPEDLIAPKRALSPIIEEPRVNLFYQFMDDHEFNILRDSNFNKHYNQDNNNVESSYDSDKVDKILTERCMDSYISFDRPESNVVLSNEVNFFRTKTINTNAYVASKTATFKNSQSDNKENEFDNSGDWMGYETAKF